MPLDLVYRLKSILLNSYGAMTISAITIADTFEKCSTEHAGGRHRMLR
jgi:hypothetical protein